MKHESIRLVEEIADLERKIHSLAKKGASNATIQPLLDVLAFKTRGLLYPHLNEYPLLNNQ